MVTIKQHLPTQDVYCRHLFKNIYIERHGDNRALISACCVNQGHMVDQAIDFHQDAHLSRQREQVRQGLRPKECNICWQQEDQGLPSHRVVSDPAMFEVELQGIDYNVSPLCNAKCITCGSWFSSSWAAEDEKFGTLESGHRSYSSVRQNTIHKNLDLSRVNRVYFNGGEPLLSDEPKDLLKIIKHQQGNLSGLMVVLNTNGSVAFDPEFLELLHQCRRVHTNFSVDAVGTEFEYIRFPLSWNLVQQNIHDVIAMDLPDKQITISMVVGIHNFLEIASIKKWVEDISTPSYTVGLEILPASGHLALGNISDELKSAISDESGLCERDIVLGFVNIPKNHWSSDNTWQQRLEDIDKRRDLDWKICLPRLSRFLASKKINL